MTADTEGLTRKHIIGILAEYTGKTLTAEVLTKLADDLLQSVIQAAQIKSQAYEHA